MENFGKQKRQDEVQGPVKRMKMGEEEFLYQPKPLTEKNTPPSSPQKKVRCTPKKRAFLDETSSMASSHREGHQGIVTCGSPKTLSPSTSPMKKKLSEGSLILTVNKKLKMNVVNDLSIEGMRQTEIRELFRKEHSHLLHHIPKIFKCEPGYLKMEEAKGNVLEIEITFLAPFEFLELMEELMSFFSVMHSLGYAHEDISLRNIIVDHKNYHDFAVIDFELSGKIGVDQRRMTGAYGFSAPEMRTSRIIGPEADVYSLGKLLDAYITHQNMAGGYNFKNEALIDLIAEMDDDNHETRISLAKAIETLREIRESELKRRTLILAPLQSNASRDLPAGYEPF